MTLSLLSAATVTNTAFHSFASGGDGDDDLPKFQDQARGQRDLYTQIVISSAVGLIAFLTFCILRTEMESAVQCASTVEDGRFEASRAPGLNVWVDSGFVQN
ncbi:hypothetical protein CISG_06444 [Coccidioides immitis RMSCC 3703]|uniref:Uncharacterized protein n=1 Tax=Coccidioides immitis RMSCC 3703 TaxID=454286 RepID=A0A0J8R0N8_COCIT|nr:hypothetical protein CISG_06444 [Coccidioides immitis RMSCC 3703]